MKISELEQLANDGRLKVSKKLYRNHTRLQFIYAAKKPSRDSLDKDYLNDDYFKVKETRKIPYRIFNYWAQTLEMKEHEGYKITARDYKILVMAGAQRV